jgi:effector-binding domain-containing protein
MTHTCELKEMPAQPTLVVRTVTNVQELPSTLGAAFQAVAEHLNGLGKALLVPYVAYFNMDMDNLEIEAGFPVERATPGAGTVQGSELPPGRYGVCMYTGHTRHGPRLWP